MRKFGSALLTIAAVFGLTAMLLAQDAPKAVRLAGQLTKIDGQALTITTVDNQATVVTCNDATKIIRDTGNSGAPAKFADLQVGQQLRIYYSPANNVALGVYIANAKGPTTAPATRPAMTQVAGQLAKIDGQALTIANADSQAVVITCNATTRFVREGDPSHTQLKLSDLQVGQRVRAYYSVADNVARMVYIAKPPATGPGN